MGCFLGCFGKSKNAKCRRKNRRVLPRDLRNPSTKPVQPGFSSVRLKEKDSHEIRDNVVSSVPELAVRHKPEGHSNITAKKKVTFDSNVTRYEAVLPDEGADFPLKGEVDGGKEERSAYSNQAAENSSVTSSTVSYPPNHRYQNCRDNDEEYGELDYEDSDLSDDEDDDDEDDDDDGDLGEELEDCYFDAEDETEDSSTSRATAGQADDAIVTHGFNNDEVKPFGSNPNARDRSCYVHSVLNPVENLTQWKAVKAKGKRQLRPQKGNLVLNQDPLVSSSLELSLKDPSIAKPPCEPTKKSSQELAVDASLSNWLISSETTPVHKSSSLTFDESTPEHSISPGAKSVISYEDRPILGALTMEEIKQFTASSSPRKSPSNSPDEMPLIGTVGTYWKQVGSAKDSTSSSFKGVPNSIRKYREVSAW